MTDAAPQTKASELFVQVSDMLIRDDQPNAFDLRRLNREVDALARIDAATAFEIRSNIAALLWDLDGVQREVRNFLHLDSSTRALMNCAVTFNAMNEVDLAVDYARRAWAMAPNDEGVASDFFNVLVRSGRILEARGLIGNIKLPESMRDKAASTQRVAATIDELGISESRVHDELGAAFAVMTAKRMRVFATDFGTQSDPESGASSLVSLMSFRGDFDDEAEIVAELAGVLIDHPGWNPAQYNIIFEPKIARDDVLRAA